VTTGIEVWQWLEQVRGLDPDMCERRGVRPGQHKDLGPGVVFPYIRGGSLIAEKFRPIGEKTFRWLPVKAPHGMFNHDCLIDQTLDEQPIVITEGEIDALSVMQAGFQRVISVPDGWSETADLSDGAKMKPLIEVEHYLTKSPCVIIAADADAVGASFTRAIASLIEPHPVRLATWPDGCKDANDVLRKHDIGELVRCLNAARLVDPPGGAITGLSDLPALREGRLLRLGFDPFDQALAFEEGALSVATGYPGFGKSTFVRWCAHHLVEHEHVRIGAVELENTVHQIRDHLSRLNSGRPWNALDAAEQRALEVKLDASWRLAHKAPTGDFVENMDWIQKRIHTLAVRDRCKFIYLDPWNEIEHVLVPGETMTNYINWALKSIRGWAERYDTHVCVVAHPRKPHGDSASAPDGYDVADSSAFANKPSLGFTVHQIGGDDPHVQISVWKVRDVQFYGFGRKKLNVDFDVNTMVYRQRARSGW
jgi:twinkle protein